MSIDLSIFCLIFDATSWTYFKIFLNSKPSKSWVITYTFERNLSNFNPWPRKNTAWGSAKSFFGLTLIKYSQLTRHGVLCDFKYKQTELVRFLYLRELKLKTWLLSWKIEKSVELRDFNVNFKLFILFFYLFCVKNSKYVKGAQ